MKRALLLLLPLAACTAFEAGSGDPSPSTGSDGGAVPDAAATSDAAADAGCTFLVGDAWQPVGAAAIDGGTAVLTPDVPNQVGAVWMHVDPPATTFEASFELRHATATAADAAQGIALAWSSNQTTPPIGPSGSWLGLCGSLTDILGVAFDESHDQIELRDSRTASCADKPTGTAWPSGSAPQTALVSLAGGVVQASSASRALSQPVPNPFPIRWIGFTASTGISSYAEHTVAKVQIKVCR
jgi:hypothetical protein